MPPTLGISRVFPLRPLVLTWTGKAEDQGGEEGNTKQITPSHRVSGVEGVCVGACAGVAGVLRCSVSPFPAVLHALSPQCGVSPQHPSWSGNLRNACPCALCTAPHSPPSHTAPIQEELSSGWQPWQDGSCSLSGEKQHTLSPISPPKAVCQFQLPLPPLRLPGGLS